MADVAAKREAAIAKKEAERAEKNKAIAAEKRRRSSRAGEMRPARGLRVSWRYSLRNYVTPSPSRKYVESWLVPR